MKINWRQGRQRFSVLFIFISFFSLIIPSESYSATVDREKKKDPHVYLVGAGIASLAAAAYFIRDGHIPGDHIFIFEQSSVTGGALDGSGNPETGYSLRGGRMFTEEAYACTFDLLSFIPSLTDPTISVKEEFFLFNERLTYNSKARLIGHGTKIADAKSLGLSLRDKITLATLSVTPEKFIGNKKIEDYFTKDFFQSHFWYLWATSFAFQPWHSAVEFKRYTLRFIDEFPRLYNLGGIKRTPLNQYDAIVVPVTNWLKEQGVHFIMDTKVTNLDFSQPDARQNVGQKEKKRVERIHLISHQLPQIVHVQKEDFVVATLGSMVEATDCGSNTVVPKLKGKKDGGAWELWENIAKNDVQVGRPEVFDNRISQSKWESFTVTLKDPTFFRLMEKITGNKAGTGGLVTFKDSNWLMSIVLPKQPYFRNQPDDVHVFWGYALFVDKKGNYVKKKMSDCTGEEILSEVLYHLNIQDHENQIQQSAICIPCMMPFITSQFLTRNPGDRPAVIPSDVEHFGIIGQYVEIPDDTVFTVDYSVRSAQTAVYSLLKLNKKVTPIHKGQYDPAVLFRAFMTMLK
jgi:oleate hydratase